MKFLFIFLALSVLLFGVFGVSIHIDQLSRNGRAVKTLWGAVNDDGTAEYYPTQGKKRKHYHHQTDEDEDAIIANGGGCDQFGCFEKGGGCSLFGCFKAGGGCDLSGCW